MPKSVKYSPGFELMPGEYLKVLDEIKIAMTITEKDARPVSVPGGKGVNDS